jgi:hypothetical protein
MSAAPPNRPSELGKHLLAAARQEAPRAGSAERALELVDSAALAPEAAPPDERPAAVEPPAPRRPWAVWLLAAAVVAFGVAAFALVLPLGSDSRTPDAAAVSAEPEVPALAQPPASARVVAAPAPAPSASSSADPPAPATGAVAQRDAQRPSPAAAPQPPAPQPGGSKACGCKADDLLCAMRCSQKQKKK